jgi:Chitobiase/beta-hexosaminidase C-terminal domain/Fn3 associated
VTISDATPGASIYYTTDGSTPTTRPPLYSSPITVSSTEILQAFAVASNYSNSGVASTTFTIAPRTETPTISLVSGTYTAVQTVTIADGSAGATVYYTSDGTVPITNSPVYRGPITVSSSETVNAIAVAAGYSISTVASATYTIPPNFSIAISPPSLPLLAGYSADATITVTPWGGINSVIFFSCSGLPSGATCVFSPITVTPTSSAFGNDDAISDCPRIGCSALQEWQQSGLRSSAGGAPMLF